MQVGDVRLPQFARVVAAGVARLVRTLGREGRRQCQFIVREHQSHDLVQDARAVEPQFQIGSAPQQL